MSTSIGHKRSASGAASVPNDTIGFRGAVISPTAPVLKVPKLSNENIDRTNRGTNVPIVYTRTGDLDSLSVTHSAAPGDLIFTYKYPQGYYKSADAKPFGNGPLRNASLIGLNGLNDLLSGMHGFVEGENMLRLDSGDASMRSPVSVLPTAERASFALTLLEAYRLDGVVVTNESDHDAQSDDVVLNVCLQGPIAVNNGYKRYSANPNAPAEGGDGTGMPVEAPDTSNDYVGRVSGRAVSGRGNAVVAEYPVQMFDREATTMDHLFLGLQAVYMSTAQKRGARTKDGKLVFSSDADAASTCCVHFFYRPFSARAVERLTRDTRGMLKLGPFGSVGGAAGKGGNRQGAFDAIRKDDLAHCVGLYTVGRIMDTSAKRHASWSGGGGPTGTSFALLVNVGVEWRNGNDVVMMGNGDTPHNTQTSQVLSATLRPSARAMLGPEFGSVAMGDGKSFCKESRVAEKKLQEEVYDYLGALVDKYDKARNAALDKKENAQTDEERQAAALEAQEAARAALLAAAEASKNVPKSATYSYDTRMVVDAVEKATNKEAEADPAVADLMKQLVLVAKGAAAKETEYKAGSRYIADAIKSAGMALLAKEGANNNDEQTKAEEALERVYDAATRAVAIVHTSTDPGGYKQVLADAVKKASDVFAASEEALQNATSVGGDATFTKAEVDKMRTLLNNELSKDPDQQLSAMQFVRNAVDPQSEIIRVPEETNPRKLAGRVRKHAKAQAEASKTQSARATQVGTDEAFETFLSKTLDADKVAGQKYGIAAYTKAAKSELNGLRTRIGVIWTGIGYDSLHEEFAQTVSRRLAKYTTRIDRYIKARNTAKANNVRTDQRVYEMLLGRSSASLDVYVYLNDLIASVDKEAKALEALGTDSETKIPLASAIGVSVAVTTKEWCAHHAHALRLAQIHSVGFLHLGVCFGEDDEDIATTSASDGPLSAPTAARADSGASAPVVAAAIAAAGARAKTPIRKRAVPGGAARSLSRTAPPPPPYSLPPTPSTSLAGPSTATASTTASTTAATAKSKSKSTTSSIFETILGAPKRGAVDDDDD